MDTHNTRDKVMQQFMAHLTCVTLLQL